MPYGKGTYGSKVGRPSKAAKAKGKATMKKVKKKLSPSQKKLARAAAPKNKITGADFKALKKGKKGGSKKRK